MEITPKSELHRRLDELASIHFESNPFNDVTLLEGLISVENILIYPNVRIINELNQSFLDIMRIDYQYRSRRIVPIIIIRHLIDIAAFLYAYIIYDDKEVFKNRYSKGKAINQFEYNRKPLSYGKLIGWLDEENKGLLKLYKYCCNYVHSGYYDNKANSMFDYRFDPGYIGFLGKEYQFKEADFIDLILLNTPQIFDYEEECDITDACIWVNQILIKLIQLIRDIKT